MAANSITASEAKRLYKRQAPTHGRSKQHKEDLETISKASSPVAKAETLIAQRRTQSIDKRIEEMLQDHQGPRRNRYTYNQEAVIGLEHLHHLEGQLVFGHVACGLWRPALRQRCSHRPCGWQAARCGRPSPESCGPRGWCVALA